MNRELTCPRCGAAMNHQADKVREPASREEAESGREVVGIVVAIFACPSCGWIASVPEPSDEP